LNTNLTPDDKLAILSTKEHINQKKINFQKEIILKNTGIVLKQSTTIEFYLVVNESNENG